MASGFSLALLVKIFLIIIIFYFISKALAAFFAHYYNEQNNKNSLNNNLDYLIRLQEDKLREKGFGSQNRQNSQLDSSNQGSGKSLNLKQAYENFYKEDISSKELQGQKQRRKNDLKQIFTLIDELQWGNGKEVKAIQKKIYSYAKEKVELSTINNSLGHLLKCPKLFSALPSTILPNYGQFIQMGVIRSFLAHLAIQIENQRPAHFIKTWAKKVKTSEKNVLLAIDLFLRQAGGIREEEVLKQYFKEPKSSYYPKLTTNESLEVLNKSVWFQNNVLGFKTFESRASFYLSIITSLDPIPSLKNEKDFETAYFILNAKKEDSFESIKKKYKTLAQQKHPDKIAAKKLPEKVNKLAHENFTNLQKAYELIKTTQK
jgi:hypothetical protein